MIQRTRKNIISAFNTLIKTHNIEKITVEMILKEADVSKATFYRYFNDKYEVMNSNYKELLDRFSAPECSSSYIELYEKLYKYGIRNWKFLQRAFETTGYNSFCEFIRIYRVPCGPGRRRRTERPSGPRPPPWRSATALP